MPRRGGYHDQPLRWQQMVSAMNQRYRRAYERAKDEHYEDAENEGAGREAEIDPAEFLSGSPFNAGGKPSWEQFRGGA